jgi:hypothetical protein
LHSKGKSSHDKELVHLSFLPKIRDSVRTGVDVSSSDFGLVLYFGRNFRLIILEFPVTQLSDKENQKVFKEEQRRTKKNRRHGGKECKV